MTNKMPTVLDLLHHGSLRAGEKIYGKFKGRFFDAILDGDGFVLMSGKRYTSISIAAGTIRAQISGPAPDGLPYRRANGWTFWSRKTDDGEFEKLYLVRQNFIENNN